MDNDYYIFPKWLINIKISSDAKLLYMYMANMDLQTDNDYIYITADDIQKYLNFSQFKRRKTLQELVRNGLIKRENRGKNTKTFIYKKEDLL